MTAASSSAAPLQGQWVYYDAGEEELEVPDPKQNELKPDKDAVWSLPWAATGTGCGSSGAWSMARVTLSTSAGSIDIVSYAHAVYKQDRRHGGVNTATEYWVFSAHSEIQPPTTAAGSGTLVTALRSVAATPALQGLRRPAGKVGKADKTRESRWSEEYRLEADEAPYLGAGEIVKVRRLTPEEQIQLANHVALQSRTYGWYVIPDGVDNGEIAPDDGGGGGSEEDEEEEDDDDKESVGQLRLRWYQKMLTTESAAWRAKQLKQLYVELCELNIEQISDVVRRGVVKAAAPKIAEVLIKQLEQSTTLLDWPAGEGMAEADLHDDTTFAKELHRGLPLPIRTKVALLETPPIPEPKKDKPSKRVKSSDGAGSSSSAGGGRGAGGNRGGKKQNLGPAAAKATLISVTEREQRLQDEKDELQLQNEAMKQALRESQTQYDNDLTSLMTGYESLHSKYSSAIALLQASNQKVLALQLLGARGKFITHPPPFDPGSRPFVKQHPSVRRSGVEASAKEKRPPLMQWARARRMNPKEYTDDELAQISFDIFGNGA